MRQKRCAASAVVGAVEIVFGERDGIGDLDRFGVDGDVHAQRAQSGHEFGIEVGDRARYQFEGFALAVAAIDHQLVIGEVELDFEDVLSIRDRAMWSGLGR